MVKPRLTVDNDTAAQTVLTYVMSGFLKLLHPFMPFITEEIFSALPVSEEAIIISRFPEYDPDLSDEEYENYKKYEKLIDGYCELITAIRNARAEMNVPPKNKTKLYILAGNEDAVKSCSGFLTKLTYSSEIIFGRTEEKALSVTSGNVEAYIPLNELIDKEKELARLTKEKEFLLKEITLVQSKLSNKGFIDKAPEKLVNAEKEKERDFTAKLKKVDEAINTL
jgi:valyl-tRNA synthetase